MDTITQREQEVLKLIAFEHTIDEIADLLFLSHHTIITYRKNLFRKLNATNTVCAGTFLGFEDDVGCANGEHLHFEVGIPFDLSDPITAGGFIKGDEFIPIICNIAGNVFVQGTTETAGPCGSCLSILNNTNGTFNNQQYDIDIASVQVNAGGNVVFNAGSTGAYRAGRRIVLEPGFHAKRGSSFYATIKDCNSSPGDPNCTISSIATANNNK